MAIVIDELVVDMELHGDMMVLAITLLVYVQLGHPVVGHVFTGITRVALALLQLLVSLGWVKFAAADDGVNMASWALIREDDGVHALSRQDGAVHSPHIGICIGYTDCQQWQEDKKGPVHGARVFGRRMRYVEFRQTAIS